ncbi:hypothetical protein AAHA92_25312 [Salvia divinorum]
MDADYASQIPMVQVNDDEDFYDGPDEEYKSDDSNDENNPLNDYPDEETCGEDEDEDERGSSDEKSEGQSTTSRSPSDDPKDGSEVSYGLSDMGLEEYDWLDYADENLEDEESYCFYLITHDLMGENSSIAFEHLKLSADSEIPFDLFVSKKYKGLGLRGFVRYDDSTGNSVYTVKKSSAASDRDCVKQLFDSSGNILFSIKRVGKGSWHGYKGNGEGKEVIFTAEKHVDESSRNELIVLLINDSNNKDSKTELLMKGNPFRRSCTIYKGDSIVAQTSLMYKLGMGKVFVPRNRFRVTVFPGFADRSLVACLIAVYFDGRKLWI